MIGIDDNITVIPDVANAHFGGDDVPDEVYHPETGELVATIRYHKTDDWRGYYEADAADGWRVVDRGANCGDWDDTPTGTSNGEVESDMQRLAAEHDEIVVVLCGGSNVFCMQYDVLARVAV